MMIIIMDKANGQREDAKEREGEKSFICLWGEIYMNNQGCLPPF